MVKKVSVIFLLIANVLLLAHAAVPHHHNGGQVCFLSTPSCGGEDDHCHSAQHRHGEPERCELNDITVNKENNEQVAKYELTPQVLFYYVSVPLAGLELSEPHFFRQPPFIITAYAADAVRITGLRAPPCIYA